MAGATDRLGDVEHRSWGKATVATPLEVTASGPRQRFSPGA
jgi:hypothetical protein